MPRSRAVPVLVCALLLALAGCSSAPATAPAAGPTSAPTSAPASALASAPATAGATAPAAGSPIPIGGSGAAARRWQPKPGTSWQWQLSGTVDTGVKADVYDVDGFGTSAATVAALHARGRKVVCYVSVGSYEDFRPDRQRFPAVLLGRSDGWPGERWLDIRRTDLLRPIIAERFDMCRAKGFDAVEPDNVDGYANDTGFPLTAAEQLVFNRMVATLAHQRGLAVALKNDPDQVPQLVGDFDFAVVEQCAEYQECDQFEPFVAAGKAVFESEYNLPTSAFCPQTRRLGFSAMLKHLALDAWREPC